MEYSETITKKSLGFKRLYLDMIFVKGEASPKEEGRKCLIS